ncbi:MAG: 4-hydroxy-tetrahydrodipicolinate reductase, partial [Gammaproteobacteria bacterium]|nr:4-hydroxy-tetrahydrodipicolinate reductase [Gammaproteobacteria bacterium]
MQLFYRVAAEAARLFARAGGYDPFVLEVHHRGKRDAPSGTARRLADLCLEASPQLTEARPVPAEGPLPPHVLPVTSVRAGGEPGTHVV